MGCNGHVSPQDRVLSNLRAGLNSRSRGPTGPKQPDGPCKGPTRIADANECTTARIGKIERNNEAPGSRSFALPGRFSSGRESKIRRSRRFERSHISDFHIGIALARCAEE